MGQDKALLPWGAGVLAQHVASVVAEAAGSATLVGDPARYGRLGFACIPDLRPGLGPLSGIEAALQHTEAERNVVLACDMPHIDACHLCKLLTIDADCVVTEDESGRIHPLCAVYAKPCLPHVETALDHGRLRLLDLVAELAPATVRYPGSLQNVNTMEDWAAVH
jgi:molybdenum cofactor guanylyltransferase